MEKWFLFIVTSERTIKISGWSHSAGGQFASHSISKKFLIFTIAPSSPALSGGELTKSLAAISTPYSMPTIQSHCFMTNLCRDIKPTKITDTRVLVMKALGSFWSGDGQHFPSPILPEVLSTTITSHSSHHVSLLTQFYSSWSM